MRRTILLGLAASLLFAVPEAQAEPEGRLSLYSRLTYMYHGDLRYGRPYYEAPSTVRGKRGRKYARAFSFKKNLTGDKLKVYEEYGFTPHRLGYNGAGVRYERWKYYQEGVEFWFDGNSNLVRTNHFPAENNHID